MGKSEPLMRAVYVLGTQAVKRQALSRLSLDLWQVTKQCMLLPSYMNHIWIACPGAYPWPKCNNFYIKHDCIFYICLPANTCTVEWCKPCVPFEPLLVEKKTTSLQTLFWGERIFSEKSLGRSWTYFWLYSHSSVGNCQVGLRRTLISEFLLPCQPCWAQAVLEQETPGFPGSRFQSRVSWGSGVKPGWLAALWPVPCRSAPARRWPLRRLRRFTAAGTQLQLSGLPKMFPASLKPWGNPGHPLLLRGLLWQICPVGFAPSRMAVL